MFRQKFTWGSTLNVATPFKMASRSSSIFSWSYHRRIFLSASLCLPLLGCFWMAANDWNVLIHPSSYKNISLSCSVCDGLDIVLAMTRVQGSVHVADNHPLLWLVCWRFLMWWAKWDLEVLQTVPVGLRYKLVALLKSEGGSPTSIYVSISTVPAYP